MDAPYYLTFAEQVYSVIIDEVFQTEAVFPCAANGIALLTLRKYLKHSTNTIF